MKKGNNKDPQIFTEEIQENLKETRETAYNSQQHKDKTRSEIALYFVKAYITVIIFVFVSVFVYNILLIQMGRDNLLLEIKDIFPLVVGTVGTLLGFVLGYYFKSEEK